MSPSVNYTDVREELPDNVEILGACKSQSLDSIVEAVRQGLKHLGFNYVQEAKSKINRLRQLDDFDDIFSDVRFHMIGHLQKNKINKALPIFDCVQSVESEYRAKHINKRANKLDKVIDVLIQVNIGEEDSKNGIEPDLDKIRELSNSIEGMEYLNLKGLMTLAPYFEDAEEMRPYYSSMKDIYDRLNDEYNMDLLSMGTSHSYVKAVDEGSNLVRLGTSIFGSRK